MQRFDAHAPLRKLVVFAADRLVDHRFRFFVPVARPAAVADAEQHRNANEDVSLVGPLVKRNFLPTSDEFAFLREEAGVAIFFVWHILRPRFSRLRESAPIFRPACVKNLTLRIAKGCGRRSRTPIQRKLSRSEGTGGWGAVRLRRPAL